MLPGASAAQLLLTICIPVGKPSVLGWGTHRNRGLRNEGKTPSLNSNLLLHRQSKDLRYLAVPSTRATAQTAHSFGCQTRAGAP